MWFSIRNFAVYRGNSIWLVFAGQFISSKSSLANQFRINTIKIPVLFSRCCGSKLFSTTIFFYKQKKMYYTYWKRGALDWRHNNQFSYAKSITNYEKQNTTCRTKRRTRENEWKWKQKQLNKQRIFHRCVCLCLCVGNLDKFGVGLPRHFVTFDHFNWLIRLTTDEWAMTTIY